MTAPTDNPLNKNELAVRRTHKDTNLVSEGE